MSYHRLQSLGADEEFFDIEAALKAQGAALARLNETAERELFYRRISTYAAVAGAAFAAVKLADIWRALQRLRKKPPQ